MFTLIVPFSAPHGVQGGTPESRRHGFRFSRPAPLLWLQPGHGERQRQGMQELMGHKRIEMTMSYTHLSVDYKRSAVAKLPSFGKMGAES
jgi:hypothetical protein